MAREAAVGCSMSWFNLSYPTQSAGSGEEASRDFSKLDSLCQQGAIKIKVANLSAGLGIETEICKCLLNIITEKGRERDVRRELRMGKLLSTEVAARPRNLKERYQRGALVRFFAGDGTQAYIPGSQLVLKKNLSLLS